MANREGQLESAQHQLQQELEHKRTVEINSRELIQNEAESLKRANELMAKLAREREGGWVHGDGGTRKWRSIADQSINRLQLPRAKCAS